MFHPAVYSEHDAIVGYLEQQIAAIRASAHGLTDEQARQTPCRSTLSIGGLVKHATYVLRGRARQKADPAAPLDEAAFGIVLGNLLDNAVKYSPGEKNGDKNIRVRLEAERHLAVVHVEDAGVGLRAGEKAHIFTPFYRVGDELTRAAPGVGLGLHLVRSMTEAMNGWVRVDTPLEPATGRGTRFSVVLPRRLEPVARPLPAEPPAQVFD